MTDSYDPINVMESVFNRADPQLCNKYNEAGGADFLKQICFLNQSKDKKYKMFPNLTDDTIFGINAESTQPGFYVTNDQYYLNPPFDTDQTRQIQFAITKPQTNGETYPQGPADCLKYGTKNKRYCPLGGLPCKPGYQGKKVGPLINTPKGYKMQGWQCTSVRYKCNQTNGKCQYDPQGAFTSLTDCQTNCSKCGSKKGFVNIGGGYCFRVPANYGRIPQCRDQLRGKNVCTDPSLGFNYYCKVDNRNNIISRKLKSCTDLGNIPGGSYYCDYKRKGSKWVKCKSTYCKQPTYNYGDEICDIPDNYLNFLDQNSPSKATTNSELEDMQIKQNHFYN